MARHPDRPPFGSSRIDIMTTMFAGGIAAVAILVTLILRLVEVATNTEVPVRSWLNSPRGTVPIGAGGAPVPVTMDGGTVLVSGMPGITLASVALAALAPAATALLIVGCVLLLLRSLLTGRIFSRRNTSLVTTISVVIVAGWALTSLFSTMASNGAVANLSDRSVDTATVPTDWAPVLAALAVGAIAIAFHRGERLQRDTEGLV